MTPLLALLGAALCSLTASAEVVPLADFNLQAIAGKWYLVGFATNAQWFVTRKATMKMGTAMLTPTAEGDLDLSYSSLRSDGSCWRKNSVAKKTDVPGQFTYVCQRWGSENDMRVVDAKYDEYALVHTIKKKNGEISTVTKLYGRGEEVGATVMEKFRQLALEAGVLPENIVFLPKTPSAQLPNSLVIVWACTFAVETFIYQGYWHQQLLCFATTQLPPIPLGTTSE